MTAEVIRIGIDARGAKAGATQFEGAAGRVKRSARGIQGELVRTGRAAVNTRNFLLSLGTALGVREAVRMADTYKLINARLMNVSSSAKDAGRAYERLLELSNRTRSTIQGSSALFTKLVLSGKQFGVTQERALIITENVNKALRISGASAIEAAAAQLQLSQAIASGTLQGDEFRSVMENAPRLARALVDALDLKGGIGELRKLSKAGELTIDQLVRALTDADISEKLEAEFKNIPLTVGQAMTVLKNQLTDAIGDMDKMTYVTAGLSKAIVILAGNLNLIASVAFPLLVSWAVRASGVGLLLTRAFTAMSVAAVGSGNRFQVLSRHARIYGGRVTAVTAAKRAFTGVLRGATALLGGPWAAAITAGILLLGYLAMKKDAAARAAERMSDREGRLASVIDFSTGKIREQNQALLVNIRLKAQAALKAAEADFEEAKREARGLTRPPRGAPNLSGREVGYLPGPGDRAGPLAGSATARAVIDQVLSGRRSVQSAVSVMEQLQAKGELAAGVVERATKALGALGETAHDVLEGQSELRVLMGKGTAQDMERLGLAQPQPPITAPDLGGKTKKAKDRTAELNARLEKAQANANKLADIMSKWDEQPKLVDQAAKDKRALDEMVGEWIDINGEVQKYTQAMADLAKLEIDKGLVRELNEDLKRGKEQLVVQSLLLGGEKELAEAARRVFDYKARGIPVDQEKYELILKQVKAEYQIVEALELQQKKIDLYKGSLSEIQGAFEDLLLDFKPGKFLKSIRDSIRQLQVRLISEKIFGPLYQQVEDMITGKKGVRGANEFLAQQVQESGKSLDTFDSAIMDTAALLGQVNSQMRSILNGGIPGAIAPAPGTTTNENGDIIVTANRPPRGGGAEFSPLDMLDLVFGKITRPITDGLRHLGIKMPKMFSKEMGQMFMDGMFYSQIGPEIAGALGISKGRGLPAQIGGAVGGVLGKMGGVALGKVLGLAGNIAGPIGGIIGSVAGSLLGGLLGGKPKVDFGTAFVNDLSGEYRISSRGEGLDEAAMRSGGDVTSGLKKILDELGGTLGAFDVVIGQYDGSWRVRETSSGWNGQGGLNYKGSSGIGLHDFGNDYEAAVKFAIMNAIQDGAIQGIRESTKRLLEAGTDLDTALGKALKFEGVFRELERMKNPVIAGVQDLNRQFEELVSIFKEAAATAEEWAQLEELYSLKREQLLKDAVSQLQDFLEDLQGDKSYKTAYDRLQDADAAFKEFERKIAAGEVVDQSAFVDAGQRLQELAREVYGSTPEFFAYQNRLLEATQHAITNVEEAIAALPDPVQEAIEESISAQTSVIDQNQQTQISLLRVIANNVGGGTGSVAGELPFNVAHF